MGPHDCGKLQVTKRRRSRKQLQVEDPTEQSLAQPSTPTALLGRTSSSTTDSTPFSDAPSSSKILTDAGAATSAESKAGKRKRTAAPQIEASSALGTPSQTDVALPIVNPKRRLASKEAAVAGAEAAGATPAEAVAAAVEAVTSEEGGTKKVKRQRMKASEVAVNTEVELLDTYVKGKDNQEQSVYNTAASAWLHKAKDTKLQAAAVTGQSSSGCDIAGC